MNIVMVSPGWPPEHFANGIVSSVSQFYEAYTEMGHSPQIVTANLFGENYSENIHKCEERPDLFLRIKHSIAWRLGLPNQVMLPFVKALRNKIVELNREGKADIVEIEETWGNALYLSGHIPIPIVVRLHGPWFLNGKANGTDRANKNFTYRVKAEGRGIFAADGVTAPSDSVLSETKKYYRYSLDDAEVIPNPIKSVIESECWDKKKCEKDLILFVGRFDRHKGGDIVLKAFKRISKYRPNARLVFCGPDSGFIDDDGRKIFLEEFIRDLKISDDTVNRIAYLGRQPANRIKLLRKKAAVTIIASRYENFGNVILEAVSCGCPVVATNCGGNTEIIRHDETGLLVPNEDPNALSDAVCSLLDDQAYAAELGKNAWEDCKKRFNPIFIAEKTINFYQKVIDRFH